MPLDGLVETDWLPMPFTMNWRFTGPGIVRFEKGEPFCFITPVPHGRLDAIELVVQPLDADPALKSAYEAWSAGRADFNVRLAALEVAAVEEGWQRHYLRGEVPTGERPDFYISKANSGCPAWTSKDKAAGRNKLTSQWQRGCLKMRWVANTTSGRSSAIGRLQPDNYRTLSLKRYTILESPCPPPDAPPDLLDEIFG